MSVPARTMFEVMGRIERIESDQWSKTLFIQDSDYKGNPALVPVKVIGKNRDKLPEELFQGDLVMCYGKVAGREYQGRVFLELREITVILLHRSGRPAVEHDDVDISNSVAAPPVEYTDPTPF